MLTEFLDNNLQHRRSMGEVMPTPGKIRLTGDTTPGNVYDNLTDFLGATAHIDRFHNVEIEVTAGSYMPVDLLWGLLALRLYEINNGQG